MLFFYGNLFIFISMWIIGFRKLGVFRPKKRVKKKEKRKLGAVWHEYCLPSTKDKEVKWNFRN